MYSLPPKYNFLNKYLVRDSNTYSVYLDAASAIRITGNKPILLENILLKDGSISEYPVLSNVTSSPEVVSEYFGVSVSYLKDFIVKALENPVEPDVKSSNQYYNIETNLYKLPILYHYKGDGGYYITAGIIIAEDPEYGLNASYHRLMLIDKDRVVARILPRHLHKYIERGLKKFTICIGNTPEVLIASALSPELGVSELAIANSMNKINLIDYDGLIGSEAQIVLVGELTGEYHDEGPFVDITGTLDIVRPQPVVRIKKIYVRENAFYHAIIPAGYEHRFLMGFSKEPIIYRELVKNGIDVVDVHLTYGGVSWLHAVIKIRKKSEDDPRKTIEIAFKAHQSLKLAIVVDEDIDIYDPNDVEWALATRVQPDRDVYIYSNQIGSSLDPSADQITRKTSKWGIDATIPDLKRIRDFRKVV
ncbi:UbiD family decarboxylase [Candidatus Geothermarchaeota archaeon]|nr:MAG: UbiD family decarboxylase [Candidatus Geothermarchaeota archaeon]HEW94406.1 UbiD family decarboxylase [Thermoprotei archaeon]